MIDSPKVARAIVYVGYFEYAFSKLNSRLDSSRIQYADQRHLGMKLLKIISGFSDLAREATGFFPALRRLFCNTNQIQLNELKKIMALLLAIALKPSKVQSDRLFTPDNPPFDGINFRREDHLALTVCASVLRYDCPVNRYLYLVQRARRG